MSYDDDISTVMTENGGIESQSLSVAMDDGFYKGFEQFMGAEPPKLARLAENEKDNDNTNRKKGKNKGKKNKKDINSSVLNNKSKNNINNKNDVNSISSSILNNNSHVKSKIDTGRNKINNNVKYIVLN